MFGVIDSAFDQVTDGDDANQPLPIDHWKMANAPLGHHPECSSD